MDIKSDLPPLNLRSPEINNGYNQGASNKPVDDLEQFGWTTPKWYWNKYKIWGISLVLITLFIGILVLIIRIYISNTCIDKKYELLVFVVTEIIIGLVFIVGIKKHLPFYRNSKRGKFNGMEIMERLHNERLRQIQGDSTSNDYLKSDKKTYSAQEYNDLLDYTIELEKQNEYCNSV